jgi:hypothetical protein
MRIRRVAFSTDTVGTGEPVAVEWRRGGIVRDTCGCPGVGETGNNTHKPLRPYLPRMTTCLPRITISRAQMEAVNWLYNGAAIQVATCPCPSASP